MQPQFLSFLYAHRRVLLEIREVLFAAILMAVLALTSSYLLQHQPSTNRKKLPSLLEGLMDCGPICFIPIVAQASGRIRTIHLQEGISVRQGDLLLQLDPREMQQELKALERLIHLMEVNLAKIPIIRHASLANLYRESRQVRLELDRLTIASPCDGQIVA